MGDVPIVGGKKAPEPLYYIVENPDGSSFRLPLVMAHMFSDLALSTMASVVRDIVSQELDYRGLTKIIATASDGALPVGEKHA